MEEVKYSKAKVFERPFCAQLYERMRGSSSARNRSSNTKTIEGGFVDGWESQRLLVKRLICLLAGQVVPG